MRCCAAVDKYACLSSSSPFFVFLPLLQKPMPGNGPDTGLLGRGQSEEEQKLHSTSDTSRLSLNRMQTSLAYAHNIHIYQLKSVEHHGVQKSYLYFFLPWRPVAVDRFCVRQTSFTDDCIQRTAPITLLKTL